MNAVRPAFAAVNPSDPDVSDDRLDYVHVSDTALWVATYRALETERPDAAFRGLLASRARKERTRRASGYVRVKQAPIPEKMVVMTKAYRMDGVHERVYIIPKAKARAAGLKTAPRGVERVVRKRDLLLP